MPSLTVNLPDGRSGTLQLSDEDGTKFQQMSPEAQKSAAEGAASQLFPKQDAGQAPGQPNAQPPSAPQDGSYWNDVKGGAHDVMTGIGATAKVAGQIAGRHGYTGFASGANSVGDWLNSNAPTDPEAGNTPGQRLAEDIRNRDLSKGVGDLGHAAARTGIATAPGLAMGAIPYAGPALAGAYFGATSAGNNAQTVAANNGHQEVSDQDALQSLPATALDVVGGGVLGKAGRIASGVANPVGRAAARVGIDAAAGAGMSAGNQLGTSIGTDKGASVDLPSAAAAGLSQGAVGGVAAGRHLAGDVVQAGANRMMAAGMEPPANLDQAASVSRVVSAVKDRVGQMDASTGRPMSEFQAANNLKSQYAVEIDQAIRQARANGLSPGDASALRELANTARRHNNGISDDPSDLFRQIDGMDLPLDPQQTQRLKENVSDLNALSQSSFLNKGVGPLQKAGNLLGKVAGVGGAALSGNPLEIAASVMGMPVEGKIGGAIGAVGDRMLGLSKPGVVFQNINAQKMLRQAQANGTAVPRTDGTLPAPEADPSYAPPIAAAKRLQTAQQAALEARNGEFDDQNFLQQQADADAAARAKQADLAYKQKSQQDTAVSQQDLAKEKAFQQAEADQAKAQAQKENYLTTPDADGKPITMAQEIALWNQLLADQRDRARDDNRAMKVGKTAQEDAVDTAAKQQADFHSAAERDQAALDKASAQAELEKKRQLDTMARQAQRLRDAQAAVGKQSDKAWQKAEAPQGAAGDAIDQHLRTPQADAPDLTPQWERENAAFMAEREAALTRNERAADQVSGWARKKQQDQPAPQVADPETGLPPTPVPVNTPLPAKGKALRVDTPSSVRATVAADDAQAAPQAVQPQPAPTPAPTPQTPPAGAGRPVWSQFVANGHDAVTHDVVTQALDNMVSRGDIHPAEARALLNSQGSHPGERLYGLQKEALRLAYGDAPTGSRQGRVSPAMRDADGNEIISLPSYGAKERASRAIAANILQVHGDKYLRPVNEMLANGKTPEARQAIMQDFVDSLPKAEQAKAIEVLTPLTPFGKRTNG